jgi:hypothetical protein
MSAVWSLSGGKADMAVSCGHTAVLQERRRHRRPAIHHLAVRVRSPVGSLDDKVGRTDVHRNVEALCQPPWFVHIGFGDTRDQRKRPLDCEEGPGLSISIDDFGSRPHREVKFEGCAGGSAVRAFPTPLPRSWLPAPTSCPDHSLSVLSSNRTVDNGTFATCRRALRMSVNRGGPEVIGATTERRF